MSKNKQHQVILQKAAQLASQGLFKPAITRYRSVLKAYPDQVELWLQLAKCLGLSGQRDEAYQIHQELREVASSPELLIRISRDLEEWKDFYKALHSWELVLEHSCSKASQIAEGAFHKARLLERINRDEDAQTFLAKSDSLNNDTWGWHWLQGRLAERNASYEDAKESYTKALSLVATNPEFQSKCSSALARNADRSGDFEQAYHWLEKTIQHRAKESSKLQNQFPLTEVKISNIPSGHDNPQESPIFLTGYPRAGTTLLSRLLHESFQLNLSEEHDYLKQLVDNTGFYPKELSLEYFAKKNHNSEISAYWKAQSETIENYNPDFPLMDKNPSFAPLTPWLLKLFPNMKIIWVERDIRDLWLSSSMLDVPVNSVTCWWQSFSEYQKWHQNYLLVKKQLEDILPSEQFISIKYEDLVTQPNEELQRISKAFSLTNRSRHLEPSKVVTSPSYEESIKPISNKRINRWKSYIEFLPQEVLDQFESI